MNILPLKGSINSDLLTPKIYQQQIINPSKLLEKIKELINLEDYSLAKLYLFIMKLNNKTRNFGVKIKILLLLSEIATKEKKEQESIKLGHKIVLLVNKLNIKNYNNEVILSFLQILINSSEICQNNYLILSCWFLFIVKNLCMEKSIKNEYINEIIKTRIPFVIKKLNEEINDIKDDILDKKNNVVRLSDEVKKYLNNKNNEELYRNIKKGEKFYIINKTWVNNFLNFINKILNLNIYKNKKEIDNLFQINSICLSYFCDDENENEKEDMDDVFCGRANNFSLIKLKSFWPDIQQDYSNTYINKNILDSINNDQRFLIFEEDIYKKIKFYMGINFEIERIKSEEENISDDIELFPIKILFLNEEIRHKEKDQIMIKYMQINKNCYIDDLISKIKRGFLGYLKTNKYEILEYEYKIYLLDYNNQDIINLILSYVNMIKMYKIKGELINSEEYLKDKNLSKINLEKFLNNKYICCEVINKTSIVLPFLSIYNKSGISCPKCNLTLDLENTKKKYYPCGLCSQNIYCSELCRNSDSLHIEFHSKLSILCDNNIKSFEIKDVNIESFLDKNSRNGLVGLTNSGGNDLLLSCIQALSSCELFTKFFLIQCNKYLNDKYMAKDKNSLVSCYTELINQMWVGTEKVINPIKICDLFFNQLLKKLKINNIDALDGITILLDKFHEELNEYKNKSLENEDFYYQLPNEDDKTASNRWLKSFKAINDSIIVDLFHGQLKQILTCPYCNCEYISYPFFNCLNLPIPSKNEINKYKFRVFPYSNNLFHYIEIPYYNIDKFTKIINIKNNIKKYQIFSKSNLEALIYENNELTGILSDDSLVYDYVYNRYNFSDELFIDYEITFLEKPINKNIYIYVTPIIFDEEKKFFYTKKNVIALTYCKLFCLNKEATVFDLEKEIFKYYRRAIDDKYTVDSENNVNDSYYIEFYQKIDNEKFIDDEFRQFKMGNEPLEIYFYHNLEKNDGWFFSGPKCEFCGYTACQKSFCKFDFLKSMKLKEIQNKLKIHRPIFLLVNFKKYEHMFSIFYQPYIDKNDPKMYLNEDITIFDCFEIYSQKKKIKEEKNYICSQCNKKVIPSQIKIPYISPKYLIISFNRIQKDFDDILDYIDNKKDETIIGYPINNFDVSNYFIGNNNYDENNNIYNLLAVILHIGNIKKGHYKTLIRKKELWYEIKDEDFKKINLDKVISNPNAFILIYEKKGDLIGLDPNYDEDNIKNLNININNSILKDEKKINVHEYNKYYEEKIPLKRNIISKKKLDEMEDI